MDQETINNVSAQNAVAARNVASEVRNTLSSGSAAKISQEPMASYSPVMYGLQDAIKAISGYSEATSARAEAMSREQRNWSANQAAITREYNAAEAARNRAWQEYMSSTAHQREVADLQAAGLNPVLSAQGGNGAAVTSGATASGSNPSGAEAQPDSMTAALVSLLGNFLSAQTHLFETNMSAQTNLAVADKYNAMSKLVAEIQSATSRENTRYASDRSYWSSLAAAEASRYGANISDAINRRTLDQEMYIQEHYPNNMYQVLGSFLTGITGDTPLESGMNTANALTKAFEAGKTGINYVAEFGKLIADGVITITQIPRNLRNSVKSYLDSVSNQIDNSGRTNSHNYHGTGRR